MTGEELKELFLKQDFSSEHWTKENYYKLMWYEMEQIGHQSLGAIENIEKFKECATEIDLQSIVSDTWESDSVIRFCKDGIQELSPEMPTYEETMESLEKVKRVYKYMRIMDISKPIRKIALTGICFFCIFCTTGFVGYALEIDFFTTLFTPKKQYIEVNHRGNEDEKLYRDSYFTWMPNGYEMTGYRTEYTGYGSKTIYEYKNSEEQVITLQVRKMEDKTYSLYQEINEDSTMEEFKIKGKTYYEAQNINQNEIMWSNGDLYYTLHSEVDSNILKELIKNNEE